MGCDAALTTSLGLIITGADNVSECCAQPNVISVQEDTSCVMCKMIHKYMYLPNVTYVYEL